MLFLIVKNNLYPTLKKLLNKIMVHSYNALQPFLKYTKSFNDMAKAYYTPGQKG